MPFTSYATPEDVEHYVPGAVSELWHGSREDVEASLVRAARKINEELTGLDRFDTIPIEAEDDGLYAEVLIELTVYVSVMDRIRGIQAGEPTTDEAWKPFSDRYNFLWEGIRDGRYSFGSEPDDASSGATVVYLSRQSV